MRLLTLTLASLLLLTAPALARDYEGMEQGLFEAQNRARQNPFYYKELISEELNTKFTLNEVEKFAICYEPEDFDSQGFKKCQASRETYEGRGAWMDAIVFLSERASPKQELRYSTGLAKAC